MTTPTGTTTPPTTAPPAAADPSLALSVPERGVRNGIRAGGSPMALVPTTFLEAQSFAAVLANSSIVPKAFKGKPEDVFLAILLGAEVGFPPATALRMIHVIEGTPALSAKALSAVVLNSSLCEYLEVVETTAERCTWKTKRVGRPEQTRTWTIAMAEAARLTHKDNWKNYPHRMLSSRAKKDLCDDVYPEIVAGLYTEDEAIDMVEMTPGQFSAPPPPPGSGPVLVPDEKPKPKNAKAPKPTPPTEAKPDAKPEGAIDAEFTETKTTPAAAAPNGGLPPDAARDEAFAKAKENARVIEEERAKKAAEDKAAADAKAAAESKPADDDFGTDEPGSNVEIVGPTEGAHPDANFKLFSVFLRQANDALALDKVKALWVPWSKQDQPGHAHAPRMREAFAKRKSELGL